MAEPGILTEELRAIYAAVVGASYAQQIEALYRASAEQGHPRSRQQIAADHGRECMDCAHSLGGQAIRDCWDIERERRERRG